MHVRIDESCSHNLPCTVYHDISIAATSIAYLRDHSGAYHYISYYDTHRLTVNHLPVLQNDYFAIHWLPFHTIDFYVIDM